MKSRTAVILAFLALALAGCAGVPQQPVALDAGMVAPKSGRVGVAMTALPKIDTHFPGAGCLLCIAAASAMNSSLTAHTQKLPYEDLAGVKEQVAALIRKKGTLVTVIPGDLRIDELPRYSTEGPNIAPKDFRPLKQKYDIDKLVVLQVETLGMWRTYSSYFPTSDPKGVFMGRGYMINLGTNTYEWFQPVTVMQSAAGEWDEPPGFPALTNAYFQVLEFGKDSFLKPFN